MSILIFLSLFKNGTWPRNIHTLLRVDLRLREQVQTDDDDVRKDVHGANSHQHIRVVEGHLLGQLHHHEDDAQVGTATESVPKTDIYKQHTHT